jgi:hypothetical protein
VAERPKFSIIKSWWFHNIVAHPVAEILRLLGMKKLGRYIHDVTVPEGQS